MTTRVEVGSWYPSPAPGLPEEDNVAYTKRLMGVGSGVRPYDHVRKRGCSIGWHGDCMDPAGATCKCPCHRDTLIDAAKPGLMDKGLNEIPETLGRLYGLPPTTSANVAWLGYTAWCNTSGRGQEFEDAVRKNLAKQYPSSGMTDGFVADVMGMVSDIAGRAGR